MTLLSSNIAFVLNENLCEISGHRVAKNGPTEHELMWVPETLLNPGSSPAIPLCKLHICKGGLIKKNQRTATGGPKTNLKHKLCPPDVFRGPRQVPELCLWKEDKPAYFLAECGGIQVARSL